MPILLKLEVTISPPKKLTIEDIILPHFWNHFDYKIVYTFESCCIEAKKDNTTLLQESPLVNDIDNHSDKFDLSLKLLPNQVEDYQKLDLNSTPKLDFERHPNTRTKHQMLSTRQFCITYLENVPDILPDPALMRYENFSRNIINHQISQFFPVQ